MVLTLKVVVLTPKVVFMTTDEEKVMFLTTDDKKTLGLAQGSYFRCIENPRGGGIPGRDWHSGWGRGSGEVGTGRYPVRFPPRADYRCFIVNTGGKLGLVGRLGWFGGHNLLPS